MLRSPNGMPARRLEGLLRAMAVVLSILFILLFLYVAQRRLRYPFEVDRIESGMLTSVWRLRHGDALYSPPSLAWAPFLYAPLFFYVSAFATKLVGINYAALRLVSIVATLGSFGCLFALVWTETRRWAAALFAVGLFASLYPFVLAWYDVGRVDSLSLFFFLAALLATRRTHPLVAAVLWLLAFLTKQTFLPLGLAVFAIEWHRPRRMLTGIIAFGMMAALSVAWLNHTSQGWFSYYAFGTAGVLGWSTHSLIMYPFADLLAPAPIAAGLIVAAALFTGVRWRERDGSYFAIVTLLLGAAVGYVRAHVGANINAVIPMYAWMAVLSGVALDRLLRPVEREEWLSTLHAPPRVPAAALLWLAAATQLAAQLYRPAQIPTGNLAARVLFLNALKATPGDVWVVDHSFDAILAGKPVHADMDALDAVLGRHYAPALAELARVTGSAQLTAVVLDRTAEAYQPQGVFTTPPFSSTYRLRAVTPGGGAPGDVDQPMFTLLPCAPAQTLGSLTDLRGAFVNREGCEFVAPACIRAHGHMAQRTDESKNNADSLRE